MSHVVLVGALPESLTNFRGSLIRALVSAGHRVTAMAAPASYDQVCAIKEFGADFQHFPLQRHGFSPFQELKTMLSLRRTFRKLKPDVVLAYTIKPVIWGGFALRGVPSIRFYALITGLGFAFQGQGIVRNVLTAIVTLLYQVSLGRASAVIFQNSYNREVFVSRGIAPAEICHEVNGSGVDTEWFELSPLPDSGTVFLSIARLLSEKGLREYAQAARLVKQRFPDTVFRLVGPPDTSPDRIPLEEVRVWQEQGWIEYLGATKDVRPFLSDCHVFVLPSYHEGMPRTVLEALATGRPILTTDVPGCRETVVPGGNGYLVPRSDAKALAERMIWFIENRDQWAYMGQVSRRIAGERFDVHKINTDMVRIMELNAGASAA